MTQKYRWFREYFSDYQNLVLDTIGYWRFCSKIITSLKRKYRYYESQLSFNKDWQRILIKYKGSKSCFSGRWLYASKINFRDMDSLDDRVHVINRATTAKERKFRVNGSWIDISKPPHNNRWDVDPLTGDEWPKHSVFKPLETIPGDIRYPWEIDRMHHLVWFAQAWRYTGDAAWISEIIAQLHEVMSEALYEHGIHWRDGLQLSVRIYSLVATSDLCADANDDKFNEYIASTICAHTKALEKQLSPESEITNNHAIGETCALALSGIYQNNYKLIKQALKRLDIELKRQLYKDGIPNEGSVPYIRFDLDFITLLLLAFRKSNFTEPAWLPLIVKKMASSLAKLADRQGRIPPIGDGDDARVLRLDNEPYLNINESLLVVSKILNEDIAVCPSRGYFARWVVGDYKSCNLSKAPVLHYLSDSGYIHFNHKALDIWLDCSRAGPGGHGHNDTTAIILHYDGQGLLHDPGWYTYHGDPVIRNYLRSTNVHNTVIVDNIEQAELVGLFGIFDQCLPVRIKTRQINKSLFVISCGHTGYDRLNKNIFYKRSVIISGEGPWKIRVVDKVISDKALNARIHLGSNEKWISKDGNCSLLNKHIWRPISGLVNIEINPAIYSTLTGVLTKGSSIDSKIDEIFHQDKGAYNYISRWELLVQE